MHNPLAKWLNLSVFFLFASALLLVISILGMNHVINLSGLYGEKSANYVLIAGVFGAIVSILFFMLVRAKKKGIDALFDGTDTLAHWQYTREEWAQFALNEVLFETKSKKSKLKTSLWVLGIAFVAFIIFAPGSFASTFPYYIGVAVLYTILWYFTEWREGSAGTSNDANSLPEVYIGDGGVYLNNRYTAFDARPFKILYTNGAPSVLEFHWQTTSQNNNRTNHQIHVPVPREREDKVDDLMLHFGFKK
jgi:hypothetical protein